MDARTRESIKGMVKEAMYAEINKVAGAGNIIADEAEDIVGRVLHGDKAPLADRVKKSVKNAVDTATGAGAEAAGAAHDFAAGAGEHIKGTGSKVGRKASELAASLYSGIGHTLNTGRDFDKIPGKRNAFQRVGDFYGARDHFSAPDEGVRDFAVGKHALKRALITGAVGTSALGGTALIAGAANGK